MYLRTPSTKSQRALKYAPNSPTTAYTDKNSSMHRSKDLMNSVRSTIDIMISQAEIKKSQSNLAMSAVYQTNQELLNELSPSRNLLAENQELRYQLNEALRENIRLKSYIIELELENDTLKGPGPVRFEDIVRQLQALKEEGENLRENTVALLRRK